MAEATTVIPESAAPASLPVKSDAMDRPDDPLAAAFRSEEAAGLLLAFWTRVVVLGISATWLWFYIGNQPAFYIVMACFVGFVVNAWTLYQVVKDRGARSWRCYALVTFDFLLLAFSMFGPNLLLDPAWPPQIFLRETTFVFFFVVAALIALTYSPGLMMWAGLAAAAAWSLGVGVMLLLPDSVWGPPPEGVDIITHYMNPTYVHLTNAFQIALGLVLMAGVLAVVVWRSRRLVRRQMQAAAQRTNLARHFAPTMVDRLAAGDDSLEKVTVEPVAVMFVDIVGFTALAEKLSPDAVVALLREFHARVEAAVFNNGGTLDKFLGDGVMATFGTPVSGERDAVNALAAAAETVAAMADWNRTRDGAPIGIGLGIHYGPCILGDIGSERRLEYAVLGDVVNVASRLETLSRESGHPIMVSEELVAAARAQDAAAADALLEGYHAGAPRALKGRSEPIAVWEGGAAA